MKKSGNDPHGTHEGSSVLTRLSSVSIFLWLTIIILYIFLNNLIENLWRLDFLSNNVLITTGMIIISIGYLFETLGIIALGINFRIENPTDETELVTSGIYSIIRNPIVFGIFLLVIGSFLIIPIVIVLLICIFNIITFYSKTIDEEKFLLQRFGEDYKNYCIKVGRYLPYKIRKKTNLP